jgi:LysR family transcriptional activator of nhaA
MPTEDNVLRRKLDDWFEQHGVTPAIVGEFEDSALLGAFGHEGAGFFAVPAVIADEVIRQFGVEKVGQVTDVHESYYAISLERRVRHPAVAAICDVARSELFRMTRPGSDQLEHSECNPLEC